MAPDDGKQGQSTHIGNSPRQHAATFVGKAGWRRINGGRTVVPGSKRCLNGVSRIEALPPPFPLKAGVRQFSSESERWVTKSRWSERPAMSGGKCSTF